MKECDRKSIKVTIELFVFIIVFCTLSIIDKFSYIDLVYLLIVIAFFVVYLKGVKVI